MPHAPWFDITALHLHIISTAIELRCRGIPVASKVLLDSRGYYRLCRRISPVTLTLLRHQLYSIRSSHPPGDPGNRGRGRRRGRGSGEHTLRSVSGTGLGLVDSIADCDFSRRSPSMGQSSRMTFPWTPGPSVGCSRFRPPRKELFQRKEKGAHGAVELQRLVNVVVS